MNKQSDNAKQGKTIACIIGLGYVGLPLAMAFAKSITVIGYDTDSSRLEKLSKNKPDNLYITGNATDIAKADFVIICVPTPITSDKEPDLSYIESASAVVGKNMRRGSIVILESTVYPGLTEEVVIPVLERESGLRCGVDFKAGYSPERINPGDSDHSVEKMVKVVAGVDEETVELMSTLYRKVARDVYKAKNIKTAEAAKVIENIQRDLNIALMNELSIIFSKMGLDTRDVLDTSATKWNFHRYLPGLVGGHCIPVDPYYLFYKAKELGYDTRLILAGRSLNDGMPRHICEMTVEALAEKGKLGKASRILIMGLTYKENVADTRETPVKELIKQLKSYRLDIIGYEPLLGNIKDEFRIDSLSDLSTNKKFDCVIITVAHEAFRDITLDKLKSIMNDNPVLIDIRGFFDKKEAAEKGIYYRTL